MKKTMLAVLVAIVAACGFVGCKEYRIVFVDPYSPYFFNSRSLDLDYRLEYYIKKSISDSINKEKGDTNRLFMTPWVPYGYPYPY